MSGAARRRAEQAAERGDARGRQQPRDQRGPRARGDRTFGAARPSPKLVRFKSALRLPRQRQAGKRDRLDALAGSMPLTLSGARVPSRYASAFASAVRARSRRSSPRRRSCAAPPRAPRRAPLEDGGARPAFSRRPCRAACGGAEAAERARSATSRERLAAARTRSRRRLVFAATAAALVPSLPAPCAAALRGVVEVDAAALAARQQRRASSPRGLPASARNAPRAPRLRPFASAVAHGRHDGDAAARRPPLPLHGGGARASARPRAAGARGGRRAAVSHRWRPSGTCALGRTRARSAAARSAAPRRRAPRCGHARRVRRARRTTASRRRVAERARRLTNATRGNTHTHTHTHTPHTHTHGLQRGQRARRVRAAVFASRAARDRATRLRRRRRRPPPAAPSACVGALRVTSAARGDRRRASPRCATSPRPRGGWRNGGAAPRRRLARPGRAP